MRESIAKSLHAFSRLSDRCASRLSGRVDRLSDVRRQSLSQWYSDRGDFKHRLVIPDLNPGSVVFDVGGHVGQWASDLFCRYACQIYIFEPVLDHLSELQFRFACNKNVAVMPVGLAGQSRKVEISCEGVASSVFTEGRTAEMMEIELVDVAEYFQANDISRVDLMKINIEGGEYELLERLLETNLIERVKKLHIQFHDFVPQADARVAAIRDGLQKTHSCDWCYPYVWESWTRRPFGHD